MSINTAANLNSLAHIQQRVFMVVRRYKNNYSEFQDLFQDCFCEKLKPSNNYEFVERNGKLLIKYKDKFLSEKQFVFIMVKAIKQLMVHQWRQRNPSVLNKSKNSDGLKHYVSFGSLDVTDHEGVEYLHPKVAETIINQYNETDMVFAKIKYKNLFDYLDKTQDIKGLKKQIRFHYFNNNELTLKQKTQLQKAMFLFIIKKPKKLKLPENPTIDQLKEIEERKYLAETYNELHSLYIGSQQNKAYFINEGLKKLLSELKYIS